MLTLDYETEAIPERDPAYQLPCDCEDSEESAQTMNLSDACHWAEMVSARPLLQLLRKP
jgi:hypothetical protein